MALGGFLGGGRDIGKTITGLFGSITRGATSAFAKTFASAETQNGVSLFRGIDPTGSQIGRRVSQLADVEIWAHGISEVVPGGDPRWVMGTTKGVTKPVQEIAQRAVKEEAARNVLISSCNPGRHMLSGIQEGKVIYGLGYGFHPRMAEGALGASRLGQAFAWEDAVAMAEGGISKVYTKGALHQALLKQGKLPINAEGKLVVAGNKSIIGIFKDPEGNMRLGANVLSKSEQEIMASSLPLSEVPHLTVSTPQYGPQTFVTPTGQKFSNFQEAATALAREVKGVGAPGSTMPVAESLEAVNLSIGGSPASKINSQVDVVASQVHQRINDTPVANSVSVSPKGQATTGKVIPVSRTPKNIVGDLVEEVDDVARRSFKPGYVKAAGLAAAIAAGGLLLTTLFGHKKDTRQYKEYKDTSPQTDTHRGELEQTLHSTTLNKTPSRSPKAMTRIELTDADVNMKEMDSAFAHYFKQNFAYSSQ